MGHRIAFALLCTLAAGCTADADEIDVASDESDIIAASTAQILFLVNHPATDVTLLDVSVGLDKRAAEGIVAHRAGADGFAQTGDDDAFDTIAELDAVPWVGQAALEKLKSWVTANPPPADMAGVYDGVSFDAQTAALALTIARDADYEELAGQGHIWSTGAHRIVDGRPYAKLADVAATYGVGKTTMQALKAYADSGLWGTCASFASATVPAFADYAARVSAYDVRDGMYEYGFGARTAPACLDPNDVADVAALHQLVVDFAEWGYIVADWPELIEYGALLPGSGQFDWMLDGTLQHMDEFRLERLVDGDANAQADYDALVVAHDAVRALTALHPGKTWSLQIHVEGSECSQRAALFLDMTSGIVLVIHQPAQC
jgi:DNA uptake protein ComE-like DNA-binding protein